MRLSPNHPLCRERQMSFAPAVAATPLTVDHYSIRLLAKRPGSAWYLIRERDEYGEYPNIFVKCIFHEDGDKPRFIVLSDTGTGFSSSTQSQSQAPKSRRPGRVDIASFLEQHLNKDHRAPYIVVSTHCHYDHIMGIRKLQEAGANVLVLASSYDMNFISPWANLQKHSLCDKLGLEAPHYEVRWIDDLQEICLRDERSSLLNTAVRSGIIVLHTPGHTADSLSWYDADYHILSVGDTFYECESDDTRSGSNQWPREPPQPIIFPQEGNLEEWKLSLERLLAFVRTKNSCLAANDEDGQRSHVDRRVSLCAAHVTAATDAEEAIEDVLEFMEQVELDRVPRKLVSRDAQGETWQWQLCFEEPEPESVVPSLDVFRGHRFSLRALWKTIHPQ